MKMKTEEFKRLSFMLDGIKLINDENEEEIYKKMDEFRKEKMTAFVSGKITFEEWEELNHKFLNTKYDVFSAIEVKKHKERQKRIRAI